MPSSTPRNPLTISGYRKLWLFILLPPLLLGVCLTGYFVSSQVVLARQSHQDKAIRLALRLAAAVSTDMPHWGTDRLLAWLSGQPERQRVSRLQIVDLEGRVVAAFVAEPAPESLFGPVPAIKEPILSPVTAQAETQTAYSSITGHIHVSLSPAYLNEQIMQSLGQAASMALGVLLLLSGFGWYLKNFLIAPLHQLDLRLGKLLGEADAAEPVQTDYGPGHLVVRWNLQLDRFVRENRTLTLRLSYQERFLRDKTSQLAQALAQADIERRARLLFLAEVESQLRPRLVQLAQSRQPVSGCRTGQAEPVAAAGAFGLIPVFDSLLSDWRQDVADHECRLHSFDLRQYFEHLMGLLMASLPHVVLIPLISPDLPRTVFGDSVGLTRILGRWLIQLGRVMHHGNLVVRAKPSLVRGQPGWLVLVHAPIRELAPEIRQRMTVLFSSGLASYRVTQGNGPVPGIDAMVKSMNGLHGTTGRETEGVFYYLHLPLEQTADCLDVPVMHGIRVCVIDSIPLSRKAWMEQLQHLGIKACGCEAVEQALACLDGTACVRIIVLSQQDFWRHASKAEAFIDTCLLLKAWPVLILPYGDFEGRDYYRRAGAICLNKPVRNKDWCNLIETLRQRATHSVDPPVAPDPVQTAGIATATHQVGQSGLAPGSVRTAVDEPGSAVSGYVTALLAATRNNRTLAVRLLTKLLGELPVQLQGIREALQAGETRKARDMVHQMNGAAGLCGLAAMQQAANQLETALLQASEKDEYPECSALLNVLAQAVEGLLVAGPGVLQSLTPAP